MEQLHCYIPPFTIEKKGNLGNLFVKDKGVGHGFNISVIVIR